MITACAALPTRISAHGSPQPPICGTVETNPKRLAPKSHALAAGVSPFTAAASWAKPSTCGIMTFLGCIPDLPLNLSCRRFQKSSSHFHKEDTGKGSIRRDIRELRDLTRRRRSLLQNGTQER